MDPKQGLGLKVCLPPFAKDLYKKPKVRNLSGRLSRIPVGFRIDGFGSEILPN